MWLVPDSDFKKVEGVYIASVVHSIPLIMEAIVFQHVIGENILAIVEPAYL